MILRPVTAAGSSFRKRVDVPLLGTKDGASKVFQTPDKFVKSSDLTITVFWNGRRLRDGRDFTLSESGGVGTGYDTVTLTPWETVGFLPRANDELVSDYFVDSTV